MKYDSICSRECEITILLGNAIWFQAPLDKSSLKNTQQSGHNGEVALPNVLRVHLRMHHCPATLGSPDQTCQWEIPQLNGDTNFENHLYMNGYCPLPHIATFDCESTVSVFGIIHIYLDGQIGFRTNPDAQRHIATPRHRSTGSLR